VKQADGSPPWRRLLACYRAPEFLAERMTTLRTAVRAACAPPLGEGRQGGATAAVLPALARRRGNTGRGSAMFSQIGSGRIPVDQLAGATGSAIPHVSGQGAAVSSASAGAARPATAGGSAAWGRRRGPCGSICAASRPPTSGVRYAGSLRACVPEFLKAAPMGGGGFFFPNRHRRPYRSTGQRPRWCVRSPGWTPTA